MNMHWKDAEAETPILWATWCEELTRRKRPWCWEGLGAGGERDDWGCDGWMASLTRWTWVWVNSGSLWWTGRPGVLQFMGSQRVRHDWATELNWTTVSHPLSLVPRSQCSQSFEVCQLCVSTSSLTRQISVSQATLWKARTLNVHSSFSPWGGSYEMACSLLALCCAGLGKRLTWVKWNFSFYCFNVTILSFVLTWGYCNLLTGF